MGTCNRAVQLSRLQIVEGLQIVLFGGTICGAIFEKGGPDRVIQFPNSQPK